MTEPTEFDPSALDGLCKVYVRHTDPLASLAANADVALGAGWEFHDVPCGHDMMLEAPGRIADLLAAIASASTAAGPADAPPARSRRYG